MAVANQRRSDSRWVGATPPHGRPLAQISVVTATPKTAELVSTGRKAPGRRNDREALEHLVRKAERLVRDGLCEHLKYCPFLPPTTADTLAHDLATVALPTADYVKVLAESDLVEVTRGAIHDGQTTESSREPDIAGRDAGAASLRITERLADRFAPILRGRLIAAHGFPPVLVDNLILHGRERALCEAVGPDTPLLEIVGLVQRLQARHALSPIFLFRALCAGRLWLFEAGLSALAGLPIAEVRVHIESAESQGFRALYKDSGLPLELFAAFRIALGVVAELGRDRFTLCRAEADERITRDLVQVYDDLWLADIETVHALLARRVAGQQSGPALPSDLDPPEHPGNLAQSGGR